MSANGVRDRVQDQRHVAGPVRGRCPGEVAQEPVEDERAGVGDLFRGGRVGYLAELDPGGEVQPGGGVVAGFLQQRPVAAQDRGADNPAQRWHPGPVFVREDRGEHGLRRGGFDLDQLA